METPTHGSAVLSGELHVVTWANRTMRFLAGDGPMIGVPVVEIVVGDQQGPIIDFLDLCYRHRIAGQIATYSRRLRRWGVLTVRPRRNGLRVDWIAVERPVRSARGALDQGQAHRLG